MISDEDLDLLEENRLVSALGRRYECWVFCAARDKRVIDDGQIVTMRTSSNGDRLRIMGLCHYLATTTAQEIYRELKDET